MEAGSVVVSVAEASSLVSLLATLSYGFASMAMVFINKAVLMQYAHSMTLLTLQQLATALLIHFGRMMGYIKAKEFSMATAKKLFPVSFFYNANVAFALASLKGVNIPMYIALKRLTPLAVLVVEFFSGKGRPPKQVSLSVILTAVGVIIAAIGDFSFDLFGYSMALTSVFFQTMYLVLVEKSGVEDGLSSIEQMFYNGILSLPILLVLIIVTGEFPESFSLLFVKANSITFLVILILSLVMGIVLNFTMFLCTIVNSALTTTIVGVLKGVVSTVWSFSLNKMNSPTTESGFVCECITYFFNHADPWFCLTRWCASARFECDWFGYQHCWWCVVFIRQISAEKEQAV